jgi:hypothetical protein
MAAPVVNRHADQVDIGPGLLYIAKLGTDEPTGLADDDWGADWVELGYTDKGSTFKIDPTVDDVRVAEERDPVQQIISAVKSTLSMDLAQITAWHLGVALGGGTVVTATGLTTFEPPEAGSEQEVMLGWRSVVKDEAMLWRRCKPNGALNLERTSGSTKALIPVEFGILIPATANTPSWKWFGADPAKTGPALSLIFA